MAGLTIGWEYLTGYAVATDATNRERVEWPPHPGRVLMALAAAWFETGEDEAEGEALHWLERQDVPELHALPPEFVTERSEVTVYVPVNDKAGPAAAALQSLPSMTRSKQPRSFPKIYVGDTPCYLRWPQVDNPTQHREALDQLCGKVTRIGHSSSLVRMWIAADAESALSNCIRYVADDGLAEFHARSISQGFLDRLAVDFGETPRRRQTALEEEIKALETERKAISGKDKRARQAVVDERIAPLQAELAALNVRPPVRPKIGLWSGYRRPDMESAESPIEHSHFDTDMLVLARVAGPLLSLTSTLAVTKAMRGAVLSHCDPVPQWVSGHQPDGERCEGDTGHLACIPLPFVGHQHADGHLLGVGLAFPRAVDRKERGRALGPLLLENTGQPRPVRLALGRLGVWTLQKTDWTERRGALLRESWTAHADGENTWASVTPVVLDRFPKTGRQQDRQGWTSEVAGIVAMACRRIGLPEPETIDIDTTSWHLGAPRALGKRRRLRGHESPPPLQDAALGDGFPRYPSRGTKAPRVQVHIWLRFTNPVVGPILLGAGRFQGYGLCKPLRGSR